MLICEIKSKNCPFCGEADKIAIPGSSLNPDIRDQIRFCVFCMFCEAEGPMGNTRAEAVLKWNTRPTEPNKD